MTTITMQTKRAQELREELEQCGDPRRMHKWGKGEPDYVRELALTAADVPQLLAEMRQWIERTEWPEDENDLTVYAPVHAWRALAQLGAIQAIEPLLAMMGAMDVDDDDWYLEEFPDAFALFGPAAQEPLIAYMQDAEHLEYPRICAGHGLQKLAERHPETRERTVAALTADLEKRAADVDAYNGFLVGYLLDLQAVESAEAIERTFAADLVDVSVAGNWNAVRAELGVEGLGLVPDHLANQRPHWFFGDPAPQSKPVGPLTGSAKRKQKRKKRKRERQNRKRGRRG